MSLTTGNDTLPDALREFLEADDPSTTAELKATAEFEDATIHSVESHSGVWHVTSDDGWTVAIVKDRAVPGAPVPYPGAKLRTYSAGPGSEVDGFDIDGVEVYWRTPFQALADRIQWLANYDRRRRDQFGRQRPELDAKFDALPEPLKARITRFREESPAFRVESESYELFACVEAAKIAEHLRPRVEAGEDAETVVNAFKDDTDDQKRVPIDEGHSGGTFYGACGLALALLTGQEV